MILSRNGKWFARSHQQTVKQHISQRVNMLPHDANVERQKWTGEMLLSALI